MDRSESAPRGAAARHPAPCRFQLLLAVLCALALGGGGGGPPLAAAFVVGGKSFDASHYHAAAYGDASWYGGSTTFYNVRTGACGFSPGFLQTVYPAAVPEPRYSDTKTYGVAKFDGAACGQCYKLRCAPVARFAGRVYCKPGSPTITVHVVDFDAPRSPPWPLNHFDISPAAFDRIADTKAGIVNVEWQRTPCPFRRSVWILAGDSNPWYSDILVEGVSGVGAVVKVYVMEHGKTTWKAAKHLWGARWSYGGKATPDSKVMAVLGENKGIAYPVHSG